MRATLPKIRRLEDGKVVAWTGTHEYGLALVQWMERGEKPEEWPKFQSGDNWTRLIVVDGLKVWWYEQEPIRQYLEDKFMAWGSGRDFAMGVLAVGGDAVLAVKVACQFNIYCGGGVDVIELQAVVDDPVKLE